MPNPTISIVTTVYDAKDYIPRTVRSILAQSFTDFELLLVEDGSPNGCGELCDELAKTDPRIRVFHKGKRRPGLRFERWAGQCPRGLHRLCGFGRPGGSGSLRNTFECHPRK